MKQFQRRLYVTAFASSLSFLVWASLRTVQTPTNPVVLNLLYYLPILAALFTVGKLYASTRNIANRRDSSLDERQRVQRDRVHRLSYRLLAVVFLLTLTWFYLTAGTAGFGFFWGVMDRFRVVHVLGSLVLLALTLPTLVLAWLEPDPIAEDFAPSSAEEKNHELA